VISSVSYVVILLAHSCTVVAFFFVFHLDECSINAGKMLYLSFSENRAAKMQHPHEQNVFENFGRLSPFNTALQDAYQPQFTLPKDGITQCLIHTADATKLSSFVASVLSVCIESARQFLRRRRRCEYTLRRWSVKMR